MKSYEVSFYSFNAIVEAENENDAEVKAWEQLHDGYLNIEVEEVKEIEEEKV